MNKKELSGIVARRLCISPVLANNIVRQIFEEIRSQLPLTAVRGLATSLG